MFYNYTTQFDTRFFSYLYTHILLLQCIPPITVKLQILLFFRLSLPTHISSIQAVVSHSKACDDFNVRNFNFKLIHIISILIIVIVVHTVMISVVSKRQLLGVNPSVPIR